MAKIQAEGIDALTDSKGQSQEQRTFQEEYAQWRADDTAGNSVLNLFDNKWDTGWEITSGNKAARIFVELEKDELLEGFIFKPIDRMKLPQEIKVYLGTSRADLSKQFLTHSITEKYKYMRQILFNKPVKAKYLVFEFIAPEGQVLSMAEIDLLFINMTQR